MRANEFVKRFGIDDAREYLCGASFWEIDGKPIAPSVNELKRIVESYELVKNHNGISPCKFWVSMMDGCDAYQNKVDLFKRAIADVESCL